MLLVQQYLLNKTLANLIKDHGVYARVVDHKFSLNYDQIEATESDKLSQECRGLVLAHSHNNLDMDTVVGATTILGYPFNRFFNYGQDAAAKIKFDTDSTLKFYEKLDGTCIIFYFDDIKKDWCVATRSLPEANVGIDGFSNWTFTTLFKETIFRVTGFSYETWLLKANLNKDYTYIFELTTPINRIVVQYSDYNLHLLGLRNKKTLKEESAESVSGLFIKPCPSYNLNSLSDMLAFVAKRNPLEHEGVVVCNGEFKRNKIKNPEYMAYTRLKDSMANSPRALMQIVLGGKLDDLYCVMPEHLKPLSQKYQIGVQNIIKTFNKDFEEVSSEVKAMGTMSEKVTQKQFALAAQARKSWLAPMMAIYNGKVKTIQEYLESQKEQSTGDYKKSLLEHLIEKS